MIRFFVALIALSISTPFGQAASDSRRGAQQPDARQAMQFIMTRCATCHSIGAQESEDPAAPAFRDLLDKYAGDDMDASDLAQIMARHASMPGFRLSRQEAGAFQKFMRSMNR